MTKNIFLIGMPSSGKSTLGRQLAKQLGYDFIDLDSKIEIAEGLKIAEIFSLKGEDHFRLIENQQLKKIQKDSKFVIATGGGTPCFHGGMEFIKSDGISIFLDIKPDKLVDRMINSKKNERPLFDLNNKELLNSVTEKYNQRLPVYQQADLIIEGDTDADSIIWLLEKT
jgi:shikimate kinase